MRMPNGVLAVALAAAWTTAPVASAAPLAGVEVFVTTRSLDPRDTNHEADVYVRDSATGRVELVSAPAGGHPGSGPSEEPAISSNGRFVAFVTANALVPEDTNGVRDVYLFDRKEGRLTLVSRGLDGKAGNGPSWQPSIDAQGLRVAFASRASNLVPHDTNGVVDVFVWIRPIAHIVRASLGLAGQQLEAPSYLPSLSPSGEIIGFETRADLASGKASGNAQYYLVELDSRPDRRAIWMANGDQLVAVRAAGTPAPSMPAGPPPAQAPAPAPTP